MNNVVLYTIYKRESSRDAMRTVTTTPFTTENHDEALEYIHGKVETSLRIPPGKWRLETVGSNIWRLTSEDGFVEYELIDNEIVKGY